MAAVSRIPLQKCLQNGLTPNSALKTLLCGSSASTGEYQRRWATMAAQATQTQQQNKVKQYPRAKYGGRSTVTLLPGGGIGPELTGYVKEIFSYAGVPVLFEEVQIDQQSDTNEDLENAIISVRRNGVALKGNIETRSSAPGVVSRNVALRNELDLFVNVVHCYSFPGVPARHKDVDIYIIRQNTEGEYSMQEHESVPGVVESLKIVTRPLVERLARYAFEFAVKNGRKKVTTVHKANIMKAADGLFLAVAREVARDYPDIQHNDMIIDNTCMQLVWKPHQFDVMLMPNLYGSIVSNVVCGLIGGAGLLSGANYGDHYAVFEPGTRSSGTALVGKNTANPIAMISAAADMLEHLEYNHHAVLLRDAIRKTVCEDRVHTPDLGGNATSTQVVENILKHLAENVRPGLIF